MRATRDITFDIMKGVLIILVVIGHAIQVAYIIFGSKFVRNIFNTYDVSSNNVVCSQHSTLQCI